MIVGEQPSAQGKKGCMELMGWQRPTGEILCPIPSSNYHTELPGQMLASIGYFGFGIII